MSTPNPVPPPPSGFLLVDDKNPPPPPGFSVVPADYKPPVGLEHVTTGTQTVNDPGTWGLPSGEAFRGAVAAGTLRSVGGALELASKLPGQLVEEVPILGVLRPPPAVQAIPGQVGAAGGRLAERGTRTLQETQPTNPAWLERQILGAARSVPALGVAAATTFLTRNPKAGAFVAAISQVGEGYADVANRADLSENTKQAYAALTGLAEMLGEMGPQRVLLSRAPGTVQFIGKLLGVEVPTEVATNVVQQLTAQRMNVERPMSAAEWQQLVFDTIAQTILLVGAAEGPIAIGRRAGVAVEERLREQRRAELEAGLTQEAARQQAVEALRPENAQLVEQRPEIPPPPPGFQLTETPPPAPDLTPVPQQPVDVTPPGQQQAVPAAPPVPPPPAGFEVVDEKPGSDALAPRNADTLDAVDEIAKGAIAGKIPRAKAYQFYKDKMFGKPEVPETEFLEHFDTFARSVEKPAAPATPEPKATPKETPPQPGKWTTEWEDTRAGKAGRLSLKDDEGNWLESWSAEKRTSGGVGIGFYSRPSYAYTDKEANERRKRIESRLPSWYTSGITVRNMAVAKEVLQRIAKNVTGFEDGYPVFTKDFDPRNTALQPVSESRKFTPSEVGFTQKSTNKWFQIGLKGKPVWTNGHIILFGPSEFLDNRVKVRDEARETRGAVASADQTVERMKIDESIKPERELIPMAEGETLGYNAVGFVLFDRASAKDKNTAVGVNRAYFNMLNKMFPGAKWYEGQGPSKPVIVVLKGKPRAALMPIRSEQTIADVRAVAPAPKAGKVQAARSGPVQKAAWAPGANYVPMVTGYNVPPGGIILDQAGIGGPARPIAVPKTPINRRAIMAELQRQFGLKVYQGKPFKVRGAAGFFRPRNFEVRIKAHNELQVTAHEVHHWLDRTYPALRKLYHQRKFSDQLKALSYNKDNLAEGFAEFGRLFLTQEQEALTKAPEFYDAYIRTLKSEGLYRRVIAIQEKMHQWYMQGAEGRAISKIGEQPVPFNEWFARQYRDAPDQFLQKSVDWLHSFKVVERTMRGDLQDAVDSPYKNAILAAGSRGVVQAVFEHGTIAFNSKGDIEFTGPGLRQVMQPVADVFEDAMLYFLGRRAQETMKQGRERLFTKDEIEALLDRGRNSPKFAEIQQAFKDWQAFLERMMQFYIQTGIVSKESAALMRAVNQNYVPMHRIAESLDRAPGKAPAANLFKRLRGGTENVYDTWTDMLGTTGALVSQGLRNHAKQMLYRTVEGGQKGQQFAVRVAAEQRSTRLNAERVLRLLSKALGQQSKTAEDGIRQALDELRANPDIAPETLLYWSGRFRPSAPDIDMVLIDGKPVYFQIGDPLLWDTLQIWNNPRAAPLAMRMLAGFSGTLRRGVTSAPDFWLPNLIRDTMQAWAISDSGFLPFYDTLRGAAKALKRDETTWLFFANGGGFSTLLQANSAAYRKRMERFYVDHHIDYRTVIDAPYKLIDFYDAVMSAGEFGTRLGEFTKAIDKGTSVREAAYRGAQIGTDFRMHGSSQTMTWLRAGTAFFNARLQGLYLLHRQVMEKDGRLRFNPRRTSRMALRALIGMVLPTLWLWRQNKDDERYKALPDWVKWSHWVYIHPVTGTAYLFPKPFEVGAVFATIPEATMQYIVDHDGERYADALLYVLTNMFEFNIIPTAARGPFEVARNKNWAGRAITPEYLKGVASEEQFTPWTSETAILVGSTEIAKQFDISPIKFEHLLRSYLGTAAVYILAMSDALVDPKLLGMGEPPTTRPSEYFVARRFMREKPYRGTAQEQQFYDLLTEARELVQTFNKRIAEVRPDAAVAGLSTPEAQTLFATASAMEEIAAQVSEINRAMRIIRYDQTKSGDDKRRELDDLQTQKNALYDAAFEGGLNRRDLLEAARNAAVEVEQ